MVRISLNSPLALLLLVALLLASCTTMSGNTASSETLAIEHGSREPIAQDDSHFTTAYFAGGCFWCIEAAFEKVEGVIEAESGFSGGEEVNPSYKDVASGLTSHVETVKVTYDPTLVSYQELVHILLLQIDPRDAHGSFVDRGSQYRSVLFYSSEEERSISEQALTDLASLNLFGEEEFAVSVELFELFYLAEEYHQNYHAENPLRYSYYRSRSGRDQFLEPVWTEESLQEFASFLEIGSEEVEKVGFVKPSDSALREQLTEMQYYVTQEDGTERAFTGEYDSFYEKGIYVDIVSGEVLFSSLEKYDSGSGWPSFYAPLNGENIVLLEDPGLFGSRTEVRSKYADSHLGHVFSDGPEPTGLRYCINSAALRFVPASDLEVEGYAEYMVLFE